MRIWFNKTFSSIHSVLSNLRNADTDIILVFTHTHGHAPGMAVADESFLEPGDLTTEEYLEWAIRFCRDKSIDVFWPGRAATSVIANRRRFEQEGVKIVAVAEADVLELLNNKAEFYRVLNHDVALPPEAVRVNTLEEFDLAYSELKQRHERICVKPSVSVFGLGFRLVDEQRDSVTHLLSGVEYQIPWQELRAGMGQAQPFADLLVMEYLDGHEWSVDCVASSGKLWCAVQRKKPSVAGHGQIIDNQPEIAGMVERLTRHFSLNGLFNIQFKQGKYGPRLLEINPRPSGGVGMAMLSGINLAKLALHTVNNQEPPAGLADTVIHYGRCVQEVSTPRIVEGV